ncbi:MAG: 50S ribosomal protein L35 [Deltaproteobacteria bacterium]|nr:50S ribosomal protein L35 [Deltaproteobacteria bacterium]
MPKLKTKRAAVKRLSVNKNGKVKFSKAGAKHNFMPKNAKRSRRLRGSGFMKDMDAAKVRKELFPYGSPR